MCRKWLLNCVHKLVFVFWGFFLLWLISEACIVGPCSYLFCTVLQFTVKFWFFFCFNTGTLPWNCAPGTIRKTWCFKQWDHCFGFGNIRLVFNPVRCNVFFLCLHVSGHSQNMYCFSFRPVVVSTFSGYYNKSCTFQTLCLIENACPVNFTNFFSLE